MAKPESVVVYDGLPLSAGSAHGLGKISTRAAYSAWAQFLATCTSPQPIVAFFTFPDASGLDVEPAVSARIAAAFPLDERRHRHPVPTERVEEAIDLLISVEPQPTNAWGCGASLALGHRRF